jgi:3-oxoacyl-[acyl-carrier protein] reductase
MKLGIEGKTALVAGSSRGLGRAVAEALAEEGVKLVLCARSQEPVEAAAREIRERFGVEARGYAADVSREEDVNSLVEQSVQQFGRIDILVANAGGPPASRFQDTETAQWKEGLDLNLMSTIYLSRAVVPMMRRRKWGRIIAVTSISVKQPIDNLILSNVARLGALGLAKSMASELAPDGITVNTVCPGYTRTQRLVDLAGKEAKEKRLSEQDVYQQWVGTIPMARLGEPKEFAAVVAFLASEKASYVTGTCIQVDGGFVKGVL